MKTILEDALEKYKYATKEELLDTCAAGFGYGFPKDCPEDCEKCWNREYREVKQDDVPGKV